MLAPHSLTATLLLGLSAGCVSLTIGCASSSPRPQLMPDGTLRVECESEVSYCVRRAESFCGNDPVKVIAAGSREGQHGDARYSDGARITTVDFVCGKSHSVDLRFRRKKAEPPPVESPAPATPAPATAPPVCTAGATQQCVGAGACAGGQICRSDGSGWGDCDCGTDTNPPPPPSAPSTTPGRDAKPELPAD